MQQLLHRRLSRITEPHLLFPLVAGLLLLMAWATTLGVIRVERDAAGRNAANLTRQLLDTYEVQVSRALHEIDQTLELVKFWPNRRNDRRSLAELRSEDLLPTQLLFTISIADRSGDLLETTQSRSRSNIADQDYFRQQRDHDGLFIGQPVTGGADSAVMHFSRRLSTADGAFDGVVILTVEASYFVSGYEPAKLGNQGLLGILGLGGQFLVKRTGDLVTAGTPSKYGEIVQSADADSTDVRIARSNWDGVSRWTGARELNGFPLAICVGLSVEEQLHSIQQLTHRLLWAAALVSLVIIGIAALLWRLHWQLTQAHLRESESRIEHARQVEYLAYHDGLTGLPNRSLFSKLLAQSIDEARAHGQRLAVAFLDLDRFKQINDTLGHEAGDKLLRDVADRLRSCVRNTDTVARLGGDEFVVLLQRIPDEQVAGTIAQKILHATAQPFDLIGQEFRITTSIGISTYPRDGEDEQTLTKHADIAMYQAKAEGKNNFQFYSESLNSHSLERLTLESSLRRALERGEFVLHYQAKRDIASGRITGVEALLRWNHPDLGTLAPLRFIPIAEETGLILPIGRWVLRTACAQCAAWQQRGLPHLAVAVNLTSRQFRDEQLLTDVKAILEATALEPRHLEIELHESLLLRDVEETLRTLTQLRALGIRIALDDFGTGYSSLAMLHRFPLDSVKIDRSITREFVGKTVNTALAANIIAMGKALSLTVVAQGVETREQADVLREQACDELQGFYFKRPLPPEQLTELLREQHNLESQNELACGAA